MQQPFVSIALPTKNRAFLLGDCIRFALDQSYENLEVVVADNDDTNATQEVVSRFNDPRLRHVKTGGLSMPDNWEAAFHATRGDLIMMLEDKQFLKYHAVETLVRHFEDAAVDVVTWGSDSFDDLGRFRRVWTPPASRKTEVLTCDEVLDRFLHGKSSEWSHFLPIAHLSAVRRDLAEKVKMSVTGRQFLPMNPDYTSAFQWLAHGGRVACLAEALVVYSTKLHSNGRAIQLKLPASVTFFEELKSKDSIGYDRIPVKVMTIPGAIYNDYIRLQGVLGGRLARHPVDIARLYLAIHGSISGALREGVDMSGELATWRGALDLELPAVRESVLRQIKPTRRRNQLLALAAKVENLVKGAWKTWVLRGPYWRHPTAASYIAAQKHAYLLQKAALTTS
jgi:hypothetical protein